MLRTGSPARFLPILVAFVIVWGAAPAFTQAPANNASTPPLGSDLVIGKAPEFGHQGKIGMLVNNGGGFDLSIAGFSGFTGYEVALGDVNGDGKDDVVAVAHTGQVYLALGDFPNGLQPGSITQVGAFPEVAPNCCERTRAFQLADVNGDTRLDIVTTQWTKLAAMLGNGNGTFGGAQFSNMAGSDSRGLAVGDVTGDGIADAIVSNASGNWSLWVHKGNGNGTFAAPSHIPNSDLAVPNLFLRDADGDGDLDVFSGSFESTFKVYVNNGTGTFVETNSGGGSGVMLIADDLNGDGNVDVVTGAGNTLTVTVAGGPVTTYPISNNARHGAIGDFNADGKADVAVVAVDIFAGAAHDGELWILHGDGNGTFGVPQHVATYRNNFTIAAGKLGAPSDATPPVVTPSVSGTLVNDWYTSDVTVSWAVSDPESAVTSSACAAQTVTADTTGTTFTCSATSAGGTTSQSVTIKRDTTGPAIASATPSTSSLWPANNKLVAVSVSVSASDAGSNGVVCSITSVGSSEGGSAHEPDVELTGLLSMNLRAEREGKGSGRIYTAHITCKDAAGNASTTTTAIAVPHDQGKK